MRFTKKLRHLAVVLTTGLVVSCAMESAPTAPPPTAEADLVGGVLGSVDRLVSGLLTCKPLKERTDEQMIGPAGGRLVMGPHRLEIPAGALTQMTRIRGEIRSDSINSVRLTPEGLRFAKPAVLTLKYNNCRLLSQPMRIAYTAENLRIYYWLPSADDKVKKETTARLDHFSRYAIGW